MRKTQPFDAQYLECFGVIGARAKSALAARWAARGGDGGGTSWSTKRNKRNFTLECPSLVRRPCLPGWGERHDSRAQHSFRLKAQHLKTRDGPAFLGDSRVKAVGGHSGAQHFSIHSVPVFLRLVVR
jgi:hypothetical protein